MTRTILSIYLDASVVASVALIEPGWERVIGSLGNQDGIRWSDYGHGEVVSAIASRTRAQSMGAEGSVRTIAALDILALDWQRVLIESRDIDEAIDLVAKVTLNLRLPYAIHIAVARRIGATLVTNDRQQYRAARALGPSAINPLEQSPT